MRFLTLRRLFECGTVLPALALTLAACAPLTTDQPFGDAPALKVKSQSPFDDLSGHWIQISDKPGDAVSFRLRKTGDATYAGELVEEGKPPRLCEVLIRTLETHAEDNDRKATYALVFWREIDAKQPATPWAFAWLGLPVGAEKNALLVIGTDAGAFHLAGIKAESPERGPCSSKMRLTDTPEKIVATLREKDPRTFMVPAFPLVFLRQSPPTQSSPVIGDKRLTP